MRNAIIKRIAFDRIIFIDEGDSIGDIEALDTSDSARLREVLFSDGVGVYDRVIWTRDVFDHVGVFCDIGADPDYELLLRAGEYGYDSGVILWQDSGYEHPVFEDTFRLYAYILIRYREELAKREVFDQIFTARYNEASAYDIGDWFSGLVSGMASGDEAYERIKRGTLPVAIQSGMKECQGALASFAQRFGEAIRAYGMGVIFLSSDAADMTDLFTVLSRPYAAIVGFQSVLFTQELSGGVYLGDMLGAKKCNFLFDHPIYATKEFNKPVKDMYILSQDETYAEYVRDKFPHMAGVYHFPPAGIRCAGEHEKKYDITFIGTYNNYRGLFSEIRGLPPQYRKLARRMLLRQRRHPNERAEQALEHVVDEMGFEPLPEEQFANTLYAMGNVVRLLMFYFREEIVKKLLRAGIDIDVYSYSWRQAPYSDDPHLHIHDEISYEESLSVMAESRLTLNVMSWHKGGMTERIANAMLNRSVVVSDGTTYLNRNYSDMMLLFDLASYDDLPDRVRALLSDDARRDDMAEAAYKEAAKNHTWDARAREFIEIMGF